MPRTQKLSFPDRLADWLFDRFMLTPVWFGPALAVAILLFMQFALPPLVKHTNPVAQWLLLPVSRIGCWVLGGGILAIWVLAEFIKLKNRRLLDAQTGLTSIKGISWRAFECLVGEAYRRKGYVAEILGGNGPDGGIDVRLRRDGKTILVQCKHWKVYWVSVAVVRELLGVMVSEKANGGIVVTSGKFSIDACAFARRNPQIELVDGPKLADLIRDVQAPMGAGTAPIAVPISQPPSCPLCSAVMVMRTARQGQFAGQDFWGCSKYPPCRGTRHIEAAQTTR